MGKAGVFGVGAVVVLGAAYIGAAAYSGGAVQKEYDTAFDKMGQALPFVKIVDRKFDKGLFSSTASYGVRIGCDPQEGGGAVGQSMTVTFRDTITHGPLPGFAGVGLARIDTQIVLPPEAPAELRKWIESMKPDAIRTTIAFGGASVTRVELPGGEVKDKEASLHWKPVRFSASMNGAHTHLDYDVEVPEVAFDITKDGDTGSFKLINLRMQNSSDLAAGAFLMTGGNGSGSLDSLRFSADKAGVLVDLHQLKLTSTAKTENDLLGTTASLTGALDVKAGGKEFKFEKIELQESMKRIHAPTLQKIMLGFWGEVGNICRKTPDELAKSLQGKQAEMLLGMKDLLAHDPEYSIDKIAVTWEGKEGQISYSLASHGITPEDLQQADPTKMLALMGKVTTKASAKLPLAWIEKIVAEVKGGSPQEARAQIEGLLAPFVQAGYIVREGDYVSTSSVMERGKITINGKPFDPAALMGLSQNSHPHPEQEQEQGGEEEKND